MALTTTADRIIDRGPCWDEKRVRRTLSSQEKWSALDFFRLYDENVLTAEELLWVVLYNDLIEPKTLHALACDFAEQALLAERKLGREPHPNSWNAIAVKRQWIEGKVSDQELRLAQSAVTTTTAAAAAATAAAAWASWDAAWNAAARAAAQAAARAAAQAAQTEIVRKILTEKEAVA